MDLDWSGAPMRAPPRDNGDQNFAQVPNILSSAGALQFLLGDGADKGASDEFIIGKAAVKVLKSPKEKEDIYQAVFMLACHRMSELLMSWLPTHVTKSGFDHSGNGSVEVADSYPSSPNGQEKKNAKSSRRSWSAWRSMNTSKIPTEKTKPVVMCMPQGSSKSNSVESTPTPQPRRFASASSDSYDFIDTPKTVDGIEKRKTSWPKSSRYVASSADVLSPEPLGPSIPPSNKSFGDWDVKSQCGRGNGLGDECHSDTKSQVSWPMDDGLWARDDKECDIGSPLSCGWNEPPQQRLDQHQLETKIRVLEERLADQQWTLQDLLTVQNQHKADANDATAPDPRQACTQPCTGNTAKDIIDLLHTAKSLTAHEATQQNDNSTREALHRVEVELAKLSVRDPTALKPINSDGDFAIREVKRLEGVVNRALDTIGRQTSRLDILEEQQWVRDAVCRDYTEIVERHVSNCEDQMERYPGNCDIGELNERINSAMDFDEKLLQKLDVVKERLSKLEQSSASSQNFAGWDVKESKLDKQPEVEDADDATCRNGWDHFSHGRCDDCGSLADGWICKSDHSCYVYCDSCFKKPKVLQPKLETTECSSDCGEDHTRGYCIQIDKPQAEFSADHVRRCGWFHNQKGQCCVCGSKGVNWRRDMQDSFHVYCKSCSKGMSGCAPLPEIKDTCWDCGEEAHAEWTHCTGMKSSSNNGSAYDGDDICESCCKDPDVRPQTPKVKGFCWGCGEEQRSCKCNADNESEARDQTRQLCSFGYAHVNNAPCWACGFKSTTHNWTCDPHGECYAQCEWECPYDAPPMKMSKKSTGGQAPTKKKAAAPNHHDDSISQNGLPDTCSKCGWDSHNSADCPNFGLYCNQCKASGHVCPEPKTYYCDWCGGEHATGYFCTRAAAASSW